MKCRVASATLWRLVSAGILTKLPKGGSSFASIRTSYAASAGVNFRTSRPGLLRAKKRFKNIAINDAASVPCVSGERGGECL